MVADQHQQVIDLLKDYQQGVQQSMQLLREAIGDDTVLPLQAWKSKKLPQRGRLKGDVEYQFHGIGCCLEYPDRVVDIDFGSEGRHDGFDAWRLWVFAESQPEKYPQYQDYATLRRDFEAVAASGAFSQLQGQGLGSHLYYLVP